MAGSDMEFHIPCGMQIEQVRSREQVGAIPCLIVPRTISTDDFFMKTADITSHYKGPMIFELGTITDKTTDEQIARLQMIDKARNMYGPQVRSMIKMKIDSLLRLNDHGIKADQTPRIQDYEQCYDELRHKASIVADEAHRLGFVVEYENRTHPNYAQPGPESTIPIDPQIRWQGAWSPYPALILELFSDSENIARMLKGTRGHLQLDTEHLSHAAQYSVIFNLEDAISGIRRTETLSDKEKEILSTYGTGQDGEILFDYNALSPEEEKILDKYGYIARRGQPFVFARRRSFRYELETVSECDIGSVTLGFQAYQSFWDVVDGERQLKIGSHLPNISKKYIQDDAIRMEIAENCAALHNHTWQMMNSKGIIAIELEPQLDDGQKLIYCGPVWETEVRKGMEQLRQNLQRTKTQAPYYF